MIAAIAARPRQRVACPCGWAGYRVHPNARDCPARGCPGDKIEALWTAGQGPGRSMVYLLHFHWPLQLVDGELREVPPEGFHACHYCGWTTDLPGRVRDHLAGVYVRGGKQRGRGARLVAAAIAAGATVELIRAWRAPREFEQLLKQRRDAPSPRTHNGGRRRGAARSLRPLCPHKDCGGDAAWQRWPQENVDAWVAELRAPAEARRAARDRHRAEVAAGMWDADAEWKLAFPHLAYDTPDVAQA